MFRYSRANLITCILAVLLSISIGNVIPASAGSVTTYFTPHAPILIVGNSDFISGNGVTGGHGTRSDPFLVQGWSMVSTSGQAEIRIENTTAYFLIIDVQFLNPQPGIYLTNVRNGMIENSTFSNGSNGIRIESSMNIAISGNNVSGPYYGILVADILSAPQTTGLVIQNNTFSNAGVWVSSSRSQPSGLSVTRNTFLSSDLLAESFDASIVHNNITGGGLKVEGNSTLVSDNTVTPVISYNRKHGGEIQVWGSGTLVSNNQADSIILNDATAITLSNNMVTTAVLISNNSPFDTPPFYDSHVMAGNTVNGKPLIYLALCSGSTIEGGDTGEIIVANCANVTVANLRLFGSEGIMMAYVHSGQVEGNSPTEGVSTSVDIQHSSDVRLTRNNFDGSYVSISDTDNLTMTSNHATGSPFTLLVTITGGSNIFVANNTLENNPVATAFTLSDVTNATFSENWISDNGVGLVVSGANGLNVTANNFVRNAVGLDLETGGFNGIFSSNIYHNNFVDNSLRQATYWRGMTVAFDHGYPSGGNYWSDYRGSDKCSGPQQNICSGPDGLGDPPYGGIWGCENVGGCSTGGLVDQYPRVNPYGNFSRDTSPPSWQVGSILSFSNLDATGLVLRWTRAVDDTWVSGYRVYENGTLLASVPRYVFNYTIEGLKQGSTYSFKVEAGDPGQNWSNNGPSNMTTIPRGDQSSSQPLLSLSWWIDHWSVSIIAGGSLSLVLAGVYLVRRRQITNVPLRANS